MTVSSRLRLRVAGFLRWLLQLIEGAGTKATFHKRTRVYTKWHDEQMDAFEKLFDADMKKVFDDMDRMFKKLDARLRTDAERRKPSRPN